MSEVAARIASTRLLGFDQTATEQPPLPLRLAG
jgi:hypothetical protein